MTAAEKLLERMRRSKRGGKFQDLDRLYKGFGFEATEGGKHTMYIHPGFPQFRATVARHRSVPIGYVIHAVKLIEQLRDLEGAQDEPRV